MAEIIAADVRPYQIWRSVAGRDLYVLAHEGANSVRIVFRDEGNTCPPSFSALRYDVAAWIMRERATMISRIVPPRGL